MKKTLSPKPIIAETMQTWRVAPGMIYALVRDVEKTVWIVESCPAGTRFWTPDQAAMLPQGRQTRTAVQAALRAAHTLTAPQETPVAPEFDYDLSSLTQIAKELKLLRAGRPSRRTAPRSTCVPA